MELTAGYPFWLIKNGIPFEYPKLLKNVRSRVVVIGGGISVLSQPITLLKIRWIVFWLMEGRLARAVPPQVHPSCSMNWTHLCTC